MDSDSQESLRKEQTGHKVLVLKTLWRSSLSWARRLEGYRVPCRYSSTTQHCLFPPSSKAQQLCLNVLHSALSCPKIGVFLLPKGLQDTEQEQPG